jgi:uncharacterized protein YndB with AHSA1/START domain
VFIEVVRPERLVYKHMGNDGSEPVSFVSTITFVDKGGKTELTARMVFPSVQARTYYINKYGADEGLNETIGRLAERVEGLAGQAR